LSLKNGYEQQQQPAENIFTKTGKQKGQIAFAGDLPFFFTVEALCPPDET